MALSIQIVIDISNETQGSPNVARTFPYTKLASTPTVTFSLADSMNVTSYSWQFIDIPTGSSAALSSSTAAAPTFTPDVDGTYLVQCTVNGGEDYARNAIAFTTERKALRKPASGETVEFDQADGWKAAIEQLFDIVEVSPWEVVGALDSDVLLAGSEYSFGALTFDGSDLTNIVNPYFRAIVQIDDPATTSVGTVRLYDVGAPGTPETPRLVTHLDADASTDEGVILTLSQLLTPVASPGTDVAQIEQELRTYVIRGIMTASGGSEFFKVYKAYVTVE